MGTRGRPPESPTPIVAIGTLVAIGAVVALTAGPILPTGARPAAQPGVVDVRMTPIADTTIRRTRPSEAFGTDPTLDLGRDLAPDGDTRTVLLRFALPELAPGGLVVTATLALMRLGGRGAASVAVGVASLSEPFDEAAVTWSNRPDIARSAGSLRLSATPGAQSIDVAWAVEEALAAQRHLGLQLEVPAGGCESGRGRTLASREGVAGAPELRLAYVGPGTPHPFPSPTPTATPTRTPTPTGTRPPTPTPTPTSNRQQPRPPEIVEPEAGAVLPRPDGADAWVVRWHQFAPTLCSYHIDLAGPAGTVFVTDLPNSRATCFAFDTALPGAPTVLPEGSYRWHIRSQCPPFQPQEAWSPTFTYASGDAGTATAVASPTTPPPPAGTATAAASATLSRPVPTGAPPAILLPFAAREQP